MLFNERVELFKENAVKFGNKILKFSFWDKTHSRISKVFAIYAIITITKYFCVWNPVITTAGAELMELIGYLEGDVLFCALTCLYFVSGFILTFIEGLNTEKEAKKERKTHTVKVIRKAKRNEVVKCKETPVFDFDEVLRKRPIK